MESDNIKYQSIAFICCYFGPFPWYFEYYLHSCASNPSIDFYIVTDNINLTHTLPGNVRILNETLSSFAILAKERLGVDIDLNEPYKLNDFKPAYGVIFADLLNDYKFWGFTDIDLIYGDIRYFFSDEILAEFDIFSVRPEYLSGFFSLFRNRHDVNYFFTKSKDYPHIYANPEYLSFDECSGLCMKLMAGYSINSYEAKIESMTHLIFNQSRKFNIKTYFEFHACEGRPGFLCWEDGTLLYKNEFEFILYHLIDFKQQHYISIPDWQSIPNRFNINQSSFTY